MTLQERLFPSDADMSMSSQEVFRASRSQSQASRKASRTTVTSGRRCYESFLKSNPLGSLLKTYLVSSSLHSTMFLLTWNAKATPRGRLYFQLTLSAHPTNEIGFGLLATPNTLDGMAPKSPEALEREATTTRKGRSKPANLRDQVVSMKLWPTPRQFMYKDAVTDRGKGNLGELVGGKLNPQWVEWLMGVPIGWTDSSCLETARSFKQRSLSGKES